MTLIGTLPDHIPLQKMIPLADSILASPILTVLVDNKSENGEILIQTLLERGQGILDVVRLNGRQPLDLYPNFAQNPQTAEDAALCLKNGAMGVLFPLWLHDGQTMAETITRARAYRQVVLDAENGIEKHEN